MFKGRVVDPQREKDTSIERCDVSIVDGPEESESRFVVKMNCRNGERSRASMIMPSPD